MPNQKRQMFAELIDEVRRSQSATDRFDQAVADALGINRTDMRCLDVLEREGPATAGRLAEVTGITSGAMTAVIDRLERTGYAKRVSDPSDRRRVLVQLTPQAHTIGERFYSEHMAQSQRLFARYTTAQMQLLLKFVRGGREFNEQQASLLEQRNRAERKR